ncbi:hypothetical protein BVC93_17460 [Mycobacterium sp. MS1601]|uniref:hypothetical protein n=1 Tax=Mycobacterium sp. MS1601 TaxID=1936029 RepID=UPI0009797C9F|nr:hypothetical protein [Mycobacterium sp. MS1601]AQA03920.1 hypothetical protein BVC93_17460 [Mycobacterium sp. MS1601]
MTAADWTLVPGKGLGRLELGMSPSQVDALADVYGPLESRMGDGVTDDLLRETLQLFGDGLSDQEKQDLIAAYAEHGPSSQSVTETRKDSGLILTYLADRLAEIMVSPKCLVMLDGVDLLSLGPAEALALLERLNGAPGRYADTEAAFDALALSVDGFCVTDRVAGVRIVDATDERFEARTVVARSTPYLPEHERGRFRSYSVLE